MKIKAFSDVCLWSENPKELAKFYRDILNLPFDAELTLPNDTGTQFKIGDIYFFVGYHDKIHGPAKDPYRIMVGFDIESVQEAYEELAPKGVKFIQKPTASPDKTFYVTTFLDPEGNILQFYSKRP